MIGLECGDAEGKEDINSDKDQIEEDVVFQG
jgi:hypothetical protein